MNELIKISFESENPTVSGRELHEALEIQTTKVTGKGQAYFINKFLGGVTN